MKKTIYILLFVLVASISYGQTKVTIRGNSGGGSGSTVAPTITASSATSLSLTTATTNEKTYVFTGTADATWALPAISSASKYPIRIKNRGTALLTIQRAGSDQIFYGSATTSITLLPGEAMTFQNDNTYFIAF